MAQGHIKMKRKAGLLTVTFHESVGKTTKLSGVLELPADDRTAAKQAITETLVAIRIANGKAGRLIDVNSG